MVTGGGMRRRNRKGVKGRLVVKEQWAGDDD